MKFLELRIPPPLVAIAIGFGMWWLARETGAVALPQPLRSALVWGFSALGAGFTGAAMLHFRRARTTINPLKPEQASALVTGGVYRFTRNPMYVGLLALLCAWAAHLAAPWALLGLPVFVVYLTRFQIVPEERVLGAHFGAAYADYCARVRRWL